MNSIFKEIRKLPEFEKEFRKLKTKYKTLDKDFQAFINNQLNLTHKLNIDNKGVVLLSNIESKNIAIYKARKFACKTLIGRRNERHQNHILI